MIFHPFGHTQEGFYVIFRWGLSFTITGRTFQVSDISCNIDWSSGTTDLFMNNPYTPISFSSSYTLTSQAIPFPNIMTQTDLIDINFTRSITRLSGNATSITSRNLKYYKNGILLNTNTYAGTTAIPLSPSLSTNQYRVASAVTVQKNDIITIELIETI